MSGETVQRRFPVQVLLMIAILVAVLAAGYLLVPRTEEQRLAFVERLGTTNHGTLLYPEVDLRHAGWREQNGTVWSLGEAEPRWRMVLPVGDRCDAGCEELLYVTRQIHIRLGKHADRLERVYVNVGGPMSAEWRAFLDREHPAIRILDYEAGDFARLFEGSNGVWAGEHRSYLVDPHGVSMMYHEAGQAGGDILQDLNHLLKLSAH